MKATGAKRALVHGITFNFKSTHRAPLVLSRQRCDLSHLPHQLFNDGMGFSDSSVGFFRRIEQANFLQRAITS
jgi:hypothetical protein